MTLRFFDHLCREIPGSSITLAPGEKTKEFTAPLMLIYGTAQVQDKAEGFPLLAPVKVAKRYQPGINWRGQWIWSRYINKGPNHSYVWFERTFEAPEAPEYAAIAVMADDTSSIYLNGEWVGKTSRYNIPAGFTVTKKIKKGSRSDAHLRRFYGLMSVCG